MITFLISMACIVAYSAIGGAIDAWQKAQDDLNDEIPVGIFWPLILPACIAYLIMLRLQRRGERCAEIRRRVAAEREKIEATVAARVARIRLDAEAELDRELRMVGRN